MIIIYILIIIIMFEMDDIKMCSKCDYNWTKFEWEHGKGRVAFTHPSDYIGEGEVVCSMCYKGVDEYFPDSDSDSD